MWDCRKEFWNKVQSQPHVCEICTSLQCDGCTKMWSSDEVRDMLTNERNKITLARSMIDYRDRRIEFLERCIETWEEENKDLKSKIEMLKREHIHNITIIIEMPAHMESFKTEMKVGYIDEGGRVHGIDDT